MKRAAFLKGILFISLFFCCSEKKITTNLVQPDQWWNVHPRPIYLQLELTGTYQKWFDVYKLCKDTYAIYEPKTGHSTRYRHRHRKYQGGG